MSKVIGVLSDTHGILLPGVSDFFMPCDEVWHAGDIGNVEVIDTLQSRFPCRMVYGNIDNHLIRTMTSETLVFRMESKTVAMIHIGGYPGKYTPQARTLIREHKPDILVAGHSHILKVMYDQKNKLLYINPGAAGKQGFHQVITALRFTIDGTEIRDMEVLEI